jgi:hypothetical protein
VAPAEPPAGSLGSPGRSALAAYRQRRALELAAWMRSLAWRAPLVAGAGVVGQVLAGQAGLPRAGLVGLVVAVLVGWRLRFHPSEQARTWQRGAQGERHTARLLRRLHRDGYVVFHDRAVPGFDANVDHLVIGPSGVFVLDSKQWTGSVHQSADGLVWHNHYRLDRTLGDGPMGGRDGWPPAWHPRGRPAVRPRRPRPRWRPGRPGRGDHASRPAPRRARPRPVLSDADVELLATTAWSSLRPAG